ncbi:MAG: CDP-diacylglycerol--glycerol-3-phosphate 3-phosphatidyltransferase [Bdellovibrionaceae bacterium]|nr:CDP-diacylglycerol--glycerol-3-phosphate 3-phosphatidyltransferase [Pseudobdellovibrionaceae bacterium]
MEPWKRNVPFLLTMSRVLILPVMIFLLLNDGFAWQLSAALVFAAASMTDYFDGYYARKWNLVSILGKFLDPVTDKILVSSVLIFLVYLQKVDPYSVILLLVRDTLIGGIRSVAATQKIVIDAKPTGKWKTALQMGAIPIIILSPWSDDLSIFDKVGHGLLWFSVILSMTSGIEYYRGYVKSQKA